MKLPNHERAIVPQRKITDYLLSSTHRDGRSKAAFFTRFGFSVEAWEEFAAALRRHAADHDVVETEDTPFGTSYTVEGVLVGMPPYRTFEWSGSSIRGRLTRLLTAYPVRGD